MEKTTICHYRLTFDGANLRLCILGNLNEKISPRKVAPRNHQRWAIIVGIHMLLGLRVEVDLQRGPMKLALREGRYVRVELFGQILLLLRQFA